LVASDLGGSSRIDPWRSLTIVGSFVFFDQPFATFFNHVFVS